MSTYCACTQNSLEYCTLLKKLRVTMTIPDDVLVFFLPAPLVSIALL